MKFINLLKKELVELINKQMLVGLVLSVSITNLPRKHVLVSPRLSFTRNLKKI